MRTTRALPIALAAAGAFLLVLASARSASAHARLLSSTPSDHALLSRGPEAIELRFNEILDDDFNSIEVFSASAEEGKAKNLAAGPATVDVSDRTRLSAPLPRLEPGAYAVHWKVLSRDGHTARGRLTFRVLPDRTGAY
jgi:methionine-rich copper-binding protein CopC